jgi:peptidoglycan/LPS O-acetylase OafA/YrhL
VATRAASIGDQRLLDSGEEAGTAPDDRRFRPDVEGLRAVAVLLVVLYHANVPRLTGGYVGVDVFFVISGFVITGLLLRERTGTGRTSILDFYARRCRRILPAATVVILVTVVFSYVVLGVVSGNSTADDGRWAAAFLANFHFEALGTNYLDVFRPPSPLQNYWSLSVEEQFYVVYPTLFLLVARAKGRLSLRARLAITLSLVIVASYWLSVVQTASHPTSAYFSPLTRAWELALGALVAVGTSWLKHVPRPAAAVLTWAGLAAILFAAFTFNAHTAYPGSLVAVPVVGAGLIIAGGVAMPRSGAESVLGLHPFQWLGRRSYSLYLWHWPILIIAAERVGKNSLPVGESLLWVLVALAISMVTYALVENPIRHWRRPSKQSVAAGAGLVITTIVVLSLVIALESLGTQNPPVKPAANNQVVLNQVAAAAHITTVPKNIEPSLADARGDWGGGAESTLCQAGGTQASEQICTLGDPKGKRLMVVYGDSHALMWLPAFKTMAKAADWRLVVLAKTSCPAELVTVEGHNGQGPNGPNLACNRWHQWAVHWINNHSPSVLVITQDSVYTSPGDHGSPAGSFSASQWKQGLSKLFDSIKVPGIRTILLGNIPQFAQSSPACLAAHLSDVQACSAPVHSAVLGFNQLERSTARAAGVEYVDTIPWFCSATCTAIIGRYVVYLDGIHITATWARYLESVLADALDVRPIDSSSG